ncbi:MULTISPECIES: biopolymer transporter ExbD [unclassified Luteibacter]|uniref:ExbD/TolR family protein n=1 Tax=unclassified Luteibacter TaxID=2620188 RepID=UPI0008D720C7|nr:MULTISPECIES: biopolymer transporter ExbD [unclassified Luteibacter]MDR6936051.1 biopolymer transport protein ExbD [Luteibacter sp. 3190]SEO54164.1 biopolymer transport protein ExbD [Luteibacter sp. UNC138MFCol5.1]SEV89194.1 biopolymer transport protein ExbD [Luteibacter sp. 329MFSha]
MRIGSRREDDFEINVISLIDVLLTLLMFFVLSTTFIEHSRLKVNLPKADAEAREGTDKALTLVVDRDGHYSVGSDEVLGEGIDPLKSTIERVAGPDRGRLVVIRADANTAHQNVVRAMDALGQLGFTHLSIATTPGDTAASR